MMWLVAPHRIVLVALLCGWLALLDATHEAANIGFWIIGHDDDPSLAIINRRTWLRDEPLVHVAVRAGTRISVAAEHLVERIHMASSRIPGLRGRTIDGPCSHARVDYVHGKSAKCGTKVAEAQAGALQDVYLRTKVRAMLHAICNASEDFAVIMDEDTAFYSTRSALGRPAH
jgi:hypothetical protein